MLVGPVHLTRLASVARFEPRVRSTGLQTPPVATDGRDLMVFVTSGSQAFDDLRTTARPRPELARELVAALDLNVRRVNPTDRANRLRLGPAVEWILAAVAYMAGF